ncbi:tetratricopeptide repeat protein [bacterium]|nr:MAG: tetratricopeptide repeat protein [bacterium]
MNPEVDPYAVLGVSRDCNADELKSAYRRLARENHPDIAPDKDEATLRMTQINAAWGLVGDPQRRASFDTRWRLDQRDRLLAAQRMARQNSRPKSHPAPPSKTSSTKTGHGKPTSTPANAASSAATKPKSSSKRPLVTPASRHARLAQASRLLFEQDKPNEALDLCKAVLKNDFRNTLARELMGDAYLRLGQTDRALAVWEQALVLAPGNVTLRRRWLGLMSPEARATFERKGGHSGHPQAMPRQPHVARTSSQGQGPGAAAPSRPAPPSGLLSRLVSKLKKR